MIDDIDYIDDDLITFVSTGVNLNIESIKYCLENGIECNIDALGKSFNGYIQVLTNEHVQVRQQLTGNRFMNAVISLHDIDFISYVTELKV